MADRAHRETDAILSRLEHDLDEMYDTAFDDIMEQVGDLLEEIYFDDDDPKIPKSKRYNYAKKHGLNQIITIYTNLLLDVNERAIKKINSDMDRIYYLVYSKTADIFKDKKSIQFNSFDISNEIRKKITNGFDKRAFNRLSKKSYLSNGLQKYIYQSLRKGVGYKELSTGIRKKFNVNKNSAKNIARTETTRYRSFGKLNALIEAEQQGAIIKKKWRHHHRVKKPRDWHEDMDGETAELLENFSNGLLYPGDPNGSAIEVCGCHCYLEEELIGWR